LCDGRFELGIGAGWMRTDYDQLGLPYDPPAVRVDRFEEALHIVKRCFTGEKFTYHGEHYRITDYASWPKPVQHPGPPLLVGGGGKRVLSIAAREADIVGINPNLRAGEIGLEAAKDSLREQTDLKVKWIRDAAGSRIDDIEIQMRFFITSVRPDRMKLAEALAPTFGVSPEEALESGAALVGTVDEISEQLHRRREEWGLSYVVVGDENVDEFAPVVARLAGT
jgi:probable F420-dependent oxidoreductase